MKSTEFVYCHISSSYVRDAYRALKRCFPKVLTSIDSLSLSFEEVEEKLCEKFDELQDELWY